MHPLAPTSVCQHLCMYRQRCTEKKKKKKKFFLPQEMKQTNVGESTLLFLLSIAFDPNSSASYIKHLFLIPVRTEYCFRQTLSSYAHETIAWLTLPDSLSVPYPLKLCKPRVTPNSGQLGLIWKTVHRHLVSDRDQNFATTSSIFSVLQFLNACYEKQSIRW